MSRRTPGGPDGVLVVDKPAGPTSHDVVARVRRAAGTRRVGHAGTLDPMATGVLVLGLGRATRLLTHLVGADKEYLATVRLGVATSTEDAEGEVLARAGASGVGDAALAAAVAALTGDLQQVPSSVSAKKVDGVRAHALVRAGHDVVLAARPVTVRAFDVLAVRRGVAAGTEADTQEGVAEGAEGSTAVLDADVRVECTSGTYVRALARDLGAALGVGGHLTALRRTRVGPFGVDGALVLERLAEPLPLLTPAQAAARAFPVRRLSAEEARELSHGRRLPAAGEGPGPVAAIGPDGVLVAVLRRGGEQVHPELVMTPATAP